MNLFLRMNHLWGAKLQIGKNYFVFISNIKYVLYNTSFAGVKHDKSQDSGMVISLPLLRQMKEINDGC